jgi:hypothetical protein
MLLNPIIEISKNMLNRKLCSLSLIFIVAILASSANAKPMIGTYIPFASDISLEIENNRFREGADLETGAGEWQPLSNLKEIKKGVVYYKLKGAPNGQYYCLRSSFTFKGYQICTKKRG